MPPVISGFVIRAIGIANTPGELELLTVQEASLPQLTRIIIEIPVDPSEDIESIAQQIQAVCVENNVPYWPEYPNTYAFIEGNTLYIAYVKPSGEVSPMIGFLTILPILLIIGLIAPIIMYFAIPGLAEVINSVVMILVVMMMFKMMGPMLAPKPKVAAVRAAPAAPRPPIEQRISRTIESIADSIAKIEGAFNRSKSAGVTSVTSVASDIVGVVRAVKEAPETAMSSYQKATAAGKLDRLDDKLLKYEKHLSSSQLGNLREERRIVDELRAMYD